MFTKLSWRFVLYISERCSSLIGSKVIKGIFIIHFRNFFLYFSIVTLQHIFSNSVIKYYHHSYVTFKTFLKYLYTGTINLSSIEDLLGKFVKYVTYYSFIICNLRLNYFFIADLLKLADEYCEYNLERDCTRTIKKKITVSNIFLINETALRYNKMVTSSIIYFSYCRFLSSLGHCNLWWDYYSIEICFSFLYLSQWNIFSHKILYRICEIW